MHNMLHLPPSPKRTQPMDLPSLPRTLRYSIEVTFQPEVAVLSAPPQLVRCTIRLLNTVPAAASGVITPMRR